MSHVNNRGVLFEQRQRVIDHQTGELKEERVHTLVKKTTPEFIMLFTQTSEPLRNADLTTAQTKVLFEILTGGYVLRDNRLDLTPGARDEMEKNTSLSRNTINKAISVFVDKGLIIREPGRRTGHLLNPYIFGKGRFTDLEKLRLEIATEYDFTKLEAHRSERTTGVYKQSKELAEKPHEVSEESIQEDEQTLHHTIEVKETEGGENPNQRYLNFDEAHIVEEPPAQIGIDKEIELLKEQNRAAELRNEEMKLQIELLKIQKQ